MMFLELIGSEIIFLDFFFTYEMVVEVTNDLHL